MSEKRIWELLDLLFIREGQEDETRKARSLDAILQALDQSAPPKTGRGHWLFRRRLSVFLTVILLLLFAGLGWRIHQRHVSSAAAGNAEAFDMIDTRAGSRTYITLPDSSSVILNGVCRFGYNKQFGVNQREMTLKGEAWFDIRKNPDMPLILTAGNVKIRVLGTSFNVKAYSEDSFVEATLVKGAIEVSLKTDPERAILLRPGEKIVIHQQDTLPMVLPGNKHAVQHTSTNEVIAVTKVAIDPKDSSLVETAWLKDKMVFRKEPFESLARRMEHWYNVKIEFTDPEVSTLLFTGSFEKEDIRQALQALRSSADFNYSINNGIVKISSH